MPLCALVTVKLFVETPVTFKISSSIKIKSSAAIWWVLGLESVTVKVVSELLYSAPSLIVVVKALSVVPPHKPAPQPFPPTCESRPVLIW